MVRLASINRWLSRSRAARREKIRLSQSSTCEKNSRWFTPACWRSLGVKNGINCVSHLRPQPARSRAVNESAISWQDGRIGTTVKGVGRLPETDAALDQTIGDPVVLVQADPC